jgi:hypothetical protein
MARSITAEATAAALLFALVSFDAAALDYQLQFDADCNAPPTVVRDYPIVYSLPREALFLGEEDSVKLTGGTVFGEPLVVDARQIGRFSASDPTLVVQAGRFGIARVTAATAAVCQSAPWSIRLDYAIGRGSAEHLSVSVERGARSAIAITDAGKRRFAARLASSSNGIFDALLGPEQRWTRDLLANGMDSGAIERFRVGFCPACTDDDVRWFAEHFSKYIEKVGPEASWSNGIPERITVAYRFPALPPPPPPIRTVDEEPDDPFQAIILPPMTSNRPSVSTEPGWQLDAGNRVGFTLGGAPDAGLGRSSTRFPRAGARQSIRLSNKACEKQAKRILGISDPSLLLALCDRQTSDLDIDPLPLQGSRPRPHPAKLIDLTLPARNGQPEVLLRFWNRDGTIYLYNVKGLPP